MSSWPGPAVTLVTSDTDRPIDYLTQPVHQLLQYYTAVHSVSQEGWQGRWSVCVHSVSGAMHS